VSKSREGDTEFQWSGSGGEPPHSVSQPDRLRLSGRHFDLRPVAASDYPYLQAIESGEDLLYRWRLRGATVSPEQWARDFWAGVLVQYIIVARTANRPLGALTIYRPNFQDGHAYMSAVRFEVRQPSPIVVMAAAHLISLAFRTWPFHKIYFEVPEFNLDQFVSGSERYFTVEGRMADHFWFDGRRWDQIILAVYRESWARAAPRLTLPLGSHGATGRRADWPPAAEVTP
jgi:hypothetical protein